MVETYTDKFKQIKLGEIVSLNQENFAKYGIGSSTVVIDINNKKVELGSINPSYDGTYIKVYKKDVVYFLDMVIYKKQITAWDDWVNKNITDLSLIEVGKINISFKNKKIEMTPVNGKLQNDKLVNKAIYLNSIKYLPNFKPGSEGKYEMNIITNVNETNLTFGRQLGNKSKVLLWVTKDNINFYEISSDDFSLLTGNLK